jgi:hypothetical protein
MPMQSNVCLQNVPKIIWKAVSRHEMKDNTKSHIWQHRLIKATYLFVTITLRSIVTANSISFSTHKTSVLYSNFYVASLNSSSTTQLKSGNMAANSTFQEGYRQHATVRNTGSLLPKQVIPSYDKTKQNKRPLRNAPCCVLVLYMSFIS